ncbi:Vitamin B12 import ATP-binding protein BtuD [Flavobacterium bizetiae]|uniref:Vitamin B12 import ATP-binding protein BtuD n=1 Tax=Flavobacterium bizetiae TaxID=2704140 RepID=A0A6J4GXM9_9FLAO|nr:ABC transporter ATP-binding protein [Flavobacterium bizetiae]CAA9203645.1 Vitamin B12 import ATP-binding protein BtuD [Flavobacterium bizetiae]CAD5344740.1 Vitamin B12 import ATP-binding protein BtuD [Flavobacterium bizetiae]CAD5350975.1 Vitamin B12 import ATP-binding protein BtuD [Flavobacterium bizetiae]
MEKDIILKAENISKQYRLGQVGTGTLAHDLNRWWHQVRGKENPYLKIGDVNDRSTKGTSDYVWALQDIDFEVERGEVLGIIGKNGAGKSTLLKILSKVTAPTTGSIKSRGRIASLLEVGTGFNGEMTGRENIFLNGAILGMTKKEITSKLDEIIEFSGCERYIDTPVKRYSSGMTVRLAFAVAAFLEPEILVIDEVLAVGDAEFQKKAIGKMQDISRGEGRTVLFVSHNMVAVKSLCTRGIVLEHGTVVIDSTIDNAIDYYLASDDILEGQNLIENGHFDLSNHINKKVKNIGIVSVEIFCKGQKTNTIVTGAKVEFVFKYKLIDKFNEPVLGVVIKDTDEVEIIGLNNRNTGDLILNDLLEGEIRLSFPVFRIIKSKKYKVDLYFGDKENNIDTIYDAFYFNVLTSLDGRKPIQEKLNYYYDSEIKFS